MWHVPSLLVLCCVFRTHGALTADTALDSPREKLLSTGAEKLREPDRSAPKAATGELQLPGVEGRTVLPTSEPLEDELDNQENVISQLLGDYDKVKTISSGSDCVCRCVVRPIRRSDCSRIHDGDFASHSQNFYTVETITKGTDCKKCVCMAPPSAVNPCEGEYRFKKLQEASKDDIKMATIIDLLEGSIYGMDLLKLNSVTTKLLTRMDNMERDFSRNLTEILREKERMREKSKEKDKDKKAQQKKKKVSDLERSGQKTGVAAHKQKKNESQVKKNQQQDGLEQQQPTRNATETKTSVKEKNVFIKGVTFYKADEERYEGEEEQKKERGKTTSITMNAEEDSQGFVKMPFVTKSAERSRTSFKEVEQKHISESQNKHLPTHQPKSTTKSPPIKPTHQISPTAAQQVTTKLIATSHQATPVTVRPTSSSDTNVSTPGVTLPTAPSLPKPKSRLSWTESPADQPKATKKPGVCKDTVASISEPVQQNLYGLKDGAWMKDARGHGNVIYLTSGHYGNSLLEFRDMDTFKLGQVSNTYKLPYSFTGTGHVVFNGAFYYNRAFSGDVIRYDLRHRYVSAWTTLHDALLEEQVHRTQTEVEFAVDESGLWLLYPALDTEGFHQEVILLIHLHPQDLQPVRTFRTGLRRGRYGNSFLVCGVLYAVDSMERRYANVTYAFDTHTLTHTVPSLAFTNAHAHTSQLSYCPLEKKLYAWDNGHQMMYDVIFAY